MRQQIIKIVYQDGKYGKLKYFDAIMIVKVTAHSRHLKKYNLFWEIKIMNIY